jgi:predicted nuclease of predicted toxin-antitoxin system
MRILADENMPDDAVAMIRSRGYNVLWIRTDSPGATDEANLAKAVSEQRLLITFDKDFGDLMFRRGHAASCGVVLFRIAAPSSEVVAMTIADTLDSRTDWSGHFAVVDDRRIRMTPLPTSPPRQPR